MTNEDSLLVTAGISIVGFTLLLGISIFTCNKVDTIAARQNEDRAKVMQEGLDKGRNERTSVEGIVAIHRLDYKTGKLDKTFTGCTEVNVYRSADDGEVISVIFSNDKIKRAKNGGDNYADNDDYICVYEQVSNTSGTKVRWVMRANYAVTQWNPSFKYKIEVEKK
jgi:hypothetical protein